MERQAYRFSKIVFFYLFFQLRLTQILNLKYEIQEYFEHYVRSVNEGTWIRLGKGVQVADRRHWQSAMTSPIGDVGSERVNFNFLSWAQLNVFFLPYIHGRRKLWKIVTVSSNDLKNWDFRQELPP